MRSLGLTILCAILAFAPMPAAAEFTAEEKLVVARLASSIGGGKMLRDLRGVVADIAAAASVGTTPYTHVELGRAMDHALSIVNEVGGTIRSLHHVPNQDGAFLDLTPAEWVARAQKQLGRAREFFGPKLTTSLNLLQGLNVDNASYQSSIARARDRWVRMQPTLDSIPPELTFESPRPDSGNSPQSGTLLVVGPHGDYVKAQHIFMRNSTEYVLVYAQGIRKAYEVAPILVSGYAGLETALGSAVTVLHKLFLGMSMIAGVGHTDEERAMNRFELVLEASERVSVGAAQAADASWRFGLMRTTDEEGVPRRLMTRFCAASADACDRLGHSIGRLTDAWMRWDGWLWDGILVFPDGFPESFGGGQ